MSIVKVASFQQNSRFGRPGRSENTYCTLGFTGALLVLDQREVSPFQSVGFDLGCSKN
jgi:hypothetical protein